MLEELRVRDLGVIEQLGLSFGPGMTALTGETGAGKTLVVEAIDLLLGGKADPAYVRPGAAEAVVEGRFSEADDEWVVRRVVPRQGRSRAYVNGAMASVAELAELGGRLVDLHGQHAHQSLLHPATQRNTLDLFGRIDVESIRELGAELSRIERSLTELGGDDRARARELDLLRFQLGELDAAGLDNPQEDEELEAEEDRLADAVAHQEAAAQAYASLHDDDGALHKLAGVVAALRDRGPFRAVEEQARGLVSELSELGHEIRTVAEGIEEDPERLAEIRARRQLLRDLCRKYGETLQEVIVETAAIRARCEELEGHDSRTASLQAQRETARKALRAAQRKVGAARRAAAPRLSAAVQVHLADLALAKARIEVQIGPSGQQEGDVAGDDITFLLAANPGSPLLPLAKVASGGELARAMLALRLVLSDVGYTSPPTQIFDEVDAGIGGAAATAVGEALARLARHDRQILVVTHLPQVAAWATTQVTVEKRQGEDTTASVARELTGKERSVELARMLAGSPESRSARRHATELLDAAAAARAAW